MSTPTGTERLSPETEWPSEGIETIGACPLCGAAARTLLHQCLSDRVFFCAPGRWTLHLCRDCACAYLDPRPSPETIALAYSAYYTHSPALDTRARTLPPDRRWGLALRNGYLNAQFGYHLSPALPLGGRLLGSSARARAARAVRHLALPAGEPRLLDIGCGNGAFLAEMRDFGWRAEGLEPDPAAASAARAAGLTVHQGVLTGGLFPEESFDAITLSHVLEHLHRPCDTLRICHSLLRPGGALWIATPNLDSRGHLLFGSDWVALDAPRHLVLFSPSSLTAALRQAGFSQVSAPLTTSSARWSYKASAAIAAGLDPMKARAMPLLRRWQISVTARIAQTRELRTPETAEELILLAHR